MFICFIGALGDNAAFLLSLLCKAFFGVRAVLSSGAAKTDSR